MKDVPATSLNTLFTVVAAGMAKWLDIYIGLLMVRVLLSCFPNTPWDRQPLSVIRDLFQEYNPSIVYCSLSANLVSKEQPPFDKKQFVAYMKKYIELLTPKLNAEKQAQLEKGIEGATNFLLSKLSDLQLRRLMTVVVSRMVILFHW